MPSTYMNIHEHPETHPDVPLHTENTDSSGLGFTLRPHVALITSLKILSPNAVRLKFRLQFVDEGVEDATQLTTRVRGTQELA